MIRSNLIMDKLKNIIITLLLTFEVFVVYGLTPIKNDSLHFEVLLNSKMLDDIHLKKTFINSLDITSNRLILLSTTNQFYALGWGGIKPLGKIDTSITNSYAFTYDKLLMVIRKNEIYTMDSLGSNSKLYKLPNEGMGISAGKNVMYIYDQNNNLQKFSLYVIAPHSKYAKLFEVPAPIKSVVEMNKSILFSMGNLLFSFDTQSKKIKAIAAVAKNKEIKSIAFDTDKQRIYFSTDSMICTLKDSNLVIISNEFGGILRYFNGGLIVFNPERKLLIRIMGLEEKIASLKPTIIPIAKIKQPSDTHTNKKEDVNDKQATEILTNSSIIKMVKSNLSDDLIINVINSSTVNFNTSIDSIISLSSQNVSSPVIKAMKNAMKSKTDSSSNGNNLTTTNQTAQNNTTSNTKNTTVKNFYIIARSCPTEQQANDAIAGLKSQGFPDAEIVGKNEYGSYRIAYKSYATNEEAAKALINIKQTINPSAWIFEKK